MVEIRVLERIGERKRAMATGMLGFDFGGRFWGKKKARFFPPCAEPQRKRREERKGE